MQHAQERHPLVGVLAPVCLAISGLFCNSKLTLLWSPRPCLYSLISSVSGSGNEHLPNAFICLNLALRHPPSVQPLRLVHAAECKRPLHRGIRTFTRAGLAFSEVERYRRYRRPLPRSIKTFARAGLAFSEVERDRLYLRGLLPPAILSQAVQAERVMINIRAKASDMDRHSYLTSLQVQTTPSGVGMHWVGAACHHNARFRAMML